MERKGSYGVLIVCTGNSCRSPMAEGILRKLLQERAGAGDERAAAVGITSAGTHAPAGALATREAVEVCAALGADISAHRARQLTADTVAAADLILVMEPFHLSGVYSRSQEASGKTWLLTEFAGDPDADGVPDPIGAPLSVYRETGARLENLLRTALPRILELAVRVRPA